MAEHPEVQLYFPIFLKCFDKILAFRSTDEIFWAHIAIDKKEKPEQNTMSPKVSISGQAFSFFCWKMFWLKNVTIYIYCTKYSKLIQDTLVLPWALLVNGLALSLTWEQNHQVNIASGALYSQK